jgi:hypothetical protein
MVFFTLVSYSQENDININKGEWFINTFIGFSNIEKENSYKLKSIVYGSNFGKKFNFKNNFSLLTGLEIQKISSDYSLNNEQLYIQNTLLKIPLNIRYSTNGNSKIYVDLGIYGGYLANSAQESITINSENTSKNLGSNYGVLFGFGTSQKITEYLSFKFGFVSQTDLFQSYKNTPKMSVSDLYVVNFGLGFNL